MGAASGFFVVGAEFAAMIAAIRVTGELPAPADGLSGSVAMAVLGAKVGFAEFVRSGVLVEGAATGRTWVPEQARAAAPSPGAR